MTILHSDFESRGSAEFANKESVGLYNYVTHPRTEPVILSWAIDSGKVLRVELAQGQKISKEMDEALRDPQVQMAAWNSSFERYFYKYKLGYDIPYSRWVDPQASARYLSLPDDLETCGLALNLPDDMLKDADGERLIKLFSKLTVPRKRRAKKGEMVIPLAPYFRDWTTDPEDWEKFGLYCDQDVVVERELMHRLQVFGVFPLPEREHKLWLLDQKINDRGMPQSRIFVINSSQIGIKAKMEALDKQKALTGLENPNSRDQMLAWVKERGYPFNSLRKEPVRAALEDDSLVLAPIVRDVLSLRRVSSSTSYKKLETMLRQLCSDNRLKNQFIFMGSSRCGRWSSGASQLHNMARPEEPFDEEDILDDARNLIYAADYEGLKDARFADPKKGNGVGEPLIAVKSSIRSSFEAPEGKRFNVADLKSIETCVAAWLADCKSLMAVCMDPDGDAYLDLASEMTGIPYQDLLRDYRSKDKKIKAAVKMHRQIAKPGVLGGVYRLSAGQWGIDRKTGDPVRTGLWGYAWNMGIKMTQEQARLATDTFREKYKEIVQLWYDFESAVFSVLKKGASKNATSSVGPNGCVWFDKLNRKNQNPILRMHLPSGRCLHYIDARIEDTMMPWKKKVLAEDGKTVIEQDVYKPSLVYAGVNQETKQWESYVTSHGGKLTENAVQAIARDILAEGLLRADEAEFTVVAHVHDEIVTETYDDPFDPDYRELERLMALPIAWCPGMPLGADGYSGKYYHK